MPDPLILAYIAGPVDGDGYFKITKSYRTPRIRHPYYANVLGLAQLWPGAAVHLFADTFGGDVKLVVTRSGTPMARCELRSSRAESATRRLIPFLLVKRSRTLLFLEVPRLRPKRRGRTMPTERGHERLEAITKVFNRVQEGRWDPLEECLPVSGYMRGYERLSPVQLGWSKQETFAYLAGVMDSDGNFRISKKRVQGMRWPCYRINVRCAQVKPSPAVEMLSRTFGGRIATKRERKPNCRDLASWNLHDRAASPAIEALLPYLRLKWVDTCLLLELRHLKSLGKEDLTEWEHRTRWQRVIKMRKRSYSASQVAEFERVRQNLGALHEGGRSRPSTAPAGQG